MLVWLAQRGLDENEIIQYRSGIVIPGLILPFITDLRFPP